MTRKPVVLCILDGWGINADPTASAPAQANVPNFNHIWASCPHSTLTTFGPDVGLPTGQMGNSEVGHTNIGAGRVVAMDLGAIDLAIEDGSFATNDSVVAFATKLKATGGTAHLMGVVSDGGVHGHLNHVLAACRAITAAGVPQLCIRVPGPGAYSVALLHDRNSNRKFNWTIDGIGFAGNPRLGWSKPKASATRVQAGPGLTRVPVILNYRSGLGVAPLKQG